MSQYHIKDFEIYNPKARKAIFVNPVDHTVVHVPLMVPAGSGEGIHPTLPPEDHKYHYRLMGYGLFGIVSSVTPLKFDRLI